ncbi:YolD-like family protein [Paenibacillus sp. GYB003]|uniref:YolD-like family protein n=1 Tax=Paenibacillus sp. GYB003 TaxID=2994392 RepID=UPI002F96402B
MGKKLEGNGLFESSRILLPEHREQFVLRQKDIHLRKRPELDEQLLDQFALLLLESMEEQCEVSVEKFDPWRDESVQGRIISIDMTLGRVKVLNETETVAIRLSDIVNVTRI